MCNMKCKLFILYIYSIVVDDVDAGQEPEPELQVATAVQLPAPANSAISNKDESDARIKQIQVNKLCVTIKCLMTLTGGVTTVSVPLLWLRQVASFSLRRSMSTK